MWFARKFEPTPTGVLWLILGVLAVALMWGAMYTWPSMDDYCYANRFQMQGVLATLKEEYFSWGGRFSSTMTIGVVGSSRMLMESPGFLVVPVAIMVSVMGGCWFFLSRHMPSTPPVMRLAAGCLLLVPLGWKESVFWMAGGFTYGLVLGGLLAVASVALMRGKLAWYWQMPVTILVFANAGFNEGAALLQASFLGLLTLLAIMRRWPSRNMLMLLLGASVAGVLVSFLAPGNFVRAGVMPEHNNPFDFLNGFVMPFQYIVVSAQLFLGWFALWCIWKPVALPAWVPSRIWQTVALTYALLLPALVLRSHILSGMGPERVLSTDILVLWAGTCVVALQAVHRWGGEVATETRASKWLWLMVLITILLGQTGANEQNLASRWVALMTQSRKVGGEFSKREETYLQSPGQHIIVNKLRPKLLKSPTIHEDIASDPQEWANICVSKYYGIASVQTAPR